MVMAKAITEIPDSEEDSLTSSPQAPLPAVDPLTDQQNSEQDTTTEDCESLHHVTSSHLPPDKATVHSNHGSMSPLEGPRPSSPSSVAKPKFVESPPTTIEKKLPPPMKTPQEVTLDELKAQRSALIASLKMLESVQELIAEDETSDFVSNLSGGEPTESDVMAAANSIVKKHIRLLHDYNEIKDIGQGLMGLIADSRGVRIVEVQDEFGVNPKD